MGRLTQMIEYLNSSTEDWRKGNSYIKYENFTHFNIGQKAKDYRKWYKYGKEDTFKEYLDNKKFAHIK